MREEFEPSENDHQLVKDLYEIWDNLNPRTMLEDWHDAEQIRDEALDLFSHGIVDLRTRAEIESMYWSICREVNSMANDTEAHSRRAARLGQAACRQILLQHIHIPVAPRCLGYRPALPHRAYSATQRAPYTQCYAAGHHLRQRRKDSQLRNRWPYRQRSPTSSLEEKASHTISVYSL